MASPPSTSSPTAKPGQTKRAEKMARVQWGIGALITLVGLVLWSLDLTQPAEYPALDQYANRFPGNDHPPSGDLAIIAIDDASLDSVGRWPWSRVKIAEVVEELHLAGASVVALDLTLDTPEAPGPRGEPWETRDLWRLVDADAQFGSALRDFGHVVLGSTFTFNEESQKENDDRDHANSAPKIPFSRVYHALRQDASLSDEALIRSLLPEQYVAEAQSRISRDKLVDESSREAIIAAARAEGDAEAFKGSGPSQTDLHIKAGWARIMLSRRDELSIPLPSGQRSWPSSDAPEPPVDALFRNATRLGSVSAKGTEDDDGVVRRIPLWVRHEDRLYPTLGLAAALLHLGVDVKDVRIEKDETVIPVRGSEIRLEMHRARLKGHSDVDGLHFLAWPTGAGYLDQFSPSRRLKQTKPDAKTPAPRVPPEGEVPIGLVYEPAGIQERIRRNIVETSQTILSCMRSGAITINDQCVMIQGVDLVSRQRDFQSRIAQLAALSLEDPAWMPLYELQERAWREATGTAQFLYEQSLEGLPPAMLTEEELAEAKRSAALLGISPAEETAAIERLKVASQLAAFEQFDRARTAMDRVTQAQQEIRAGLNRIREIRDDLRKRLEHKLCLVGWIATASLSDFVPTSIHTKTPGCYLHACVINSALTGYQKQVSPVAVRASSYLAIAALGLIGTLVGVRIGVVVSPVVLLLSIAAWLLIAGFLIYDKTNSLIAFSTPALVAATAWLGVILHRLLVEQIGRKQTEARFRSYVSPDVVDILVNNPELQSMVPQKRELTIMFSDIASFTTLSERLGTEGIGKLLSTYLGAMTEILQKNRATLDKYLGDGIMAFWGAPIEDPDHARHAGEAVVEMLDKLDEMNASGVFGDAAPIVVRFGLATGEVNVGDFGNPPNKSAYTVIGDSVNLSARLESANKQFGSQSLITRRMMELMAGALVFRPLGRVVVKGKTEPEELYELIGKRRPRGDKTEGWVEQTKRAVDAYISGDMDAAEREFDRLEKEFDDPKLAKLYKGAIRKLRETGVPPDFQGEIELSEK